MLQDRFDNPLTEFIQCNFNAGPHTRTFLEQTPVVFSKEAREILDHWQRELSASDIGPLIDEKLVLLETLWAIGVEAPLALGSKLQSNLSITEELGKLGIFSLPDLDRSLEERPVNLERIGHAAFTSLGDADWAIAVFLTATHTGSQDSIYVAQEFPILLEQEVNRRLGVMMEWAAAARPNLAARIDNAKKELIWLRKEISSGNLRLGKPGVFALINTYFRSSSWDDAREIIEDNLDAILSVDGIEEMNVFLESLLLQCLRTGNNPRAVGVAMQHLHLLERCRDAGVERGFESFVSLNLPIELWVIGAVLRTGSESIHSWSGFSKLLSNSNGKLGGKQHLLSGLTEWMKNSEKRERFSMISEASPVEGVTRVDFLSRTTLAYFAMLGRASEMIELFINEQELVDNTFVDSLAFFVPIISERDPYSAQSLLGLIAWLSNAHRDAILHALKSIRDEQMLASELSGADLAALVGGLVMMTTRDTDDEKLIVVDMFPALAELDSVGLAQLLAKRVESLGKASLAGELTKAIELLQSSKQIGVLATMIERDTQGMDVPVQLQALLIWNSVTTEHELREAISKYPILLEDETIKLVEGILREAERALDNLEDSVEMAAALKSSRQKYASLLQIRRRVTEDERGFVRLSPSLPGREQAEQLVSELEVSIPAGIWVPVCRIDLTDTFFQVLSAWQQQVEQWAGYSHSKNLRRVSELAHQWLSEFGEFGPQHTDKLADSLAALLLLFNKEDLQTTVLYLESSPIALDSASLDILRDWRVVAKSFGDNERIAHLDELIIYLDKAIEFDPGTAAADYGLTDSKREMLNSLAADTFGIEGVTSYTGLMKALLDLSDAEQITLAERFSAQAKPLPGVFGTVHNFQRYALYLQLKQAAEARDKQRLLELTLNEPVFFEPEFLGAIENDIPPDEFQQIQLMKLAVADPLIRRQVSGEELNEAEALELAELMGHMVAVMTPDNWGLRLVFFKNRYRELLSDRAWVLLAIYEKTIVEALSEQLDDPLTAKTHFKEVKEFVRECRETSFEDVSSKYLATHFGWGHFSDETNPMLLADHLELWAALPLGLTRELWGEPYQPLERVDKLREVLRDVNLDKKLIAQVHHEMALEYQIHYEQTASQESLANAIREYRKAIELTTESGNRRASRLISLGVALRLKFDRFGHRLEDIDEAIRALDEATALPGIDKLFQGRAYGRLGEAFTSRFEAYGRESDIQQAIEMLDKALDTTPEEAQDWLGWHIDLGVIWGGLADRFDSTQASQIALSIYERGLQRAPEGTEVWQILMVNSLGVRLHLGQIDEVIEEYTSLTEKGLLQDEYTRLFRTVGGALRQRFLQTHEIADLDSAITVYEEAIEQSERDTPDWARHLANLVMVLRDRHRFFGDDSALATATSLCKQLVESQVSKGWPLIALRTAEMHANYLGQEKHYQDAAFLFSKAIEALDAMWLSAELMDDRESYSAESELLYARLVYCCIQVDDIESAFEFAEKAKGRAFFDSLAQGRSDLNKLDASSRALLEEREILELRLRYLRGLLTQEREPVNQIRVDGSPQPFDLEEIAVEIQDIEGRTRSISRQIRRHSASLLKRQPSKPLTSRRSRAIARHLDATLLDFYQDFGGWGAFIVTERQIRHVRLEGSPDWMGWLGDLTTGGRFGRTGRFDAPLQEMYEIFFSRLEQFLPLEGSRIILATTSLQSIFPIAAATSPEGYRLLNRYTVTLAPSIAAIAQLITRAGNPDYTGMLLVAHPGKEGSHRYLKHVDVEAAAIQRIAEGVNYLHSDNATLENVVEAVDEYSILHFACHGSFDWRSPEGSGLLLANGSWLTTPAIADRLNLKSASLVVLAACEQGLEHIRGGDEHLGLARAFLRAGASSVISSLWPVDDRSTSLLMEKFYWWHLVKGLAPSEALQKAQHWLQTVTRKQLAMVYRAQTGLDLGELTKGYAENLRGGALALKERPYEDPFYWAGFVCTGL